MPNQEPNQEVKIKKMAAENHSSLMSLLEKNFGIILIAVLFWWVSSTQSRNDQVPVLQLQLEYTNETIASIKLQLDDMQSSVQDRYTAADAKRDKQELRNIYDARLLRVEQDVLANTKRVEANKR